MIIYSKICLAYPWPISPFTGPHPINAVFGEFRTPYGNGDYHFHYGVDIGASAGTEVYPVVNGRIPENNGIGPKNQEDGWVVVGNYRYVHIKLNNDLDAGDNCIAGVTLLGKVGAIDHPHLHFEEGIGIENKVNPLRVGGLDNYEDNANPSVYGGNNFMFYRQGTDIQFNTNTLWGKVDILVRAKDSQSNGSDNVGVYRIGYFIRGLQGEMSYGPVENIKFDNINGNVFNVYDRDLSNNSTYYYWVTNAPTQNRYLNTKLRFGGSWNGDDAYINAQAVLPDGKYRVWVMAYDIKGNGGDTITRHGAEYKDVLLDNFLPYVSKVEIKQEGEIRYEGEWSKNPLSYDLGTLFILKDYNFKRDKGLSFKIYFSEIMDTQKKPSLKVKFSDDRVKEVSEGNWESDTVYTATTNEDFIPDSVNGRATLEISNAYDLGGNENG